MMVSFLGRRSSGATMPSTSLLLVLAALFASFTDAVLATSSLRRQPATKHVDLQQKQRLLQEEEVTRTDLVRLIPFDVQIALSYQTESDLEAINVVALTDIITDWMSESFDTKSQSQLVAEENGGNVTTTLDSVALELVNQRIQTSTTTSQPIALLTTSYEGVSLWERMGTSPPMDPDLVELMQRATFLEDSTLLEMLQAADPAVTGFPSQDSVIDVRAFITPAGEGGDGNNDDEGSDGGSEDNQNLEIVIIVAIVVACLAFGLLIFAVVWAWRSDQKQASSDNGRSGRKSSSRRSGKKKKKEIAKSSPKTLKDESPVATPAPEEMVKDPLEGSELQFGGPTTSAPARLSTSNPNSNTMPRDEDPVNDTSAPLGPGAVVDDPYGESMVSEDISTSLTAYYKSGMYGSGGRNRSNDLNDAASMSSMDSYGYSLDGYAPSLGPAQGGYPVGPLQAAKDAQITVGDEDDVEEQEEVEDYGEA